MKLKVNRKMVKKFNREKLTILTVVVKKVIRKNFSHFRCIILNVLKSWTFMCLVLWPLHENTKLLCCLTPKVKASK